MTNAIASDRQVIAAPITAVVVSEDRARITRMLCAEFDQGHHKLRINAVSPISVDKTVCARMASNHAAIVVDIRVQRRELHEDQQREAGYQEKKTELNAYLKKLIAKQNESRLMEQQLKDLQQIRQQTLSDIAIDISWHQKPCGNPYQQIRDLREKIHAAIEADAALKWEVLQIQETVNRLKAELDEAESPPAKYYADFLLDILVKEKAEEPLIILVEYTVPNACWRPCHEARAKKGSDKLEFICLAVVWQNTGEVWKDIKVSLATQRVSLGTEVPKLITDRLFWKKKDTETIVEERQQEIFETGVRGRNADIEVPGIYDDGESRLLKTMNRTTISSTGTPIKTELFRFITTFKQDLITCPEMVNAVLRRTISQNISDKPLLPGPVVLLKEGGLIGSTSIEFVPPKAEFELGWGPDNDLRITREKLVRPKKDKRLSSWQRTVHTVINKISNLGSIPKQLVLRERLPVSEIAKLKIKHLSQKTTESPRPDEDGFIQWKVQLAPHTHKVYQLKYIVEQHNDIRWSE